MTAVFSDKKKKKLQQLPKKFSGKEINANFLANVQRLN
jgi:hypothetical protein